MADQQPEALRLAECVEGFLTGIDGIEIAAELRRLHDIEAGHIDRVDGLLAERDDLRAQVERLQAGGQVAASAMVGMTTEQRADALDAAIFGCPTVAVVAAFSKGITAAEKFHGIGLTVGGSNDLPGMWHASDFTGGETDTIKKDTP